jgi:predicted nucleic acid-binding protein
MELVVDTNELLSSVIRDSKCRELLCSPDLVLYAPEHIISEFFRHKECVIEKSGMTESDFNVLVAVLLSRINIVPSEQFISLVKTAEKIAAHPEDAPFIALCLYKGVPLWSEDKMLKKQRAVSVLNTRELLEMLPR